MFSLRRDTSWLSIFLFIFSAPLLWAQSDDTPIFEQNSAAIQVGQQEIIKEARRVREKVSALSREEIDQQLLEPQPEPIQLAASMESPGEINRLAKMGVKKDKAPVKIFILSGQSNMTGRGMLGDPKRPQDKQQATLVHYHYEETILLVKVAFGGNSLAKNFRPPSAEGETGDKYPEILKAYREAIAHLPEIIPGYTAERGHELAGFFWNQGLSDGSPEYSGEYESNLAHLIRDLRRDLESPEMPVVVAVTGNWGRGEQALLANHASYREKHPNFSHERSRRIIDGLKTVQCAQLAISQRPEFQGKVATAETRDFWRPRETHGGTGTAEHWNANGESYWLIGASMAKEMLQLMTAAPVTVTPSAPSAPDAPDVQALQADFRKLGFGMFIHYNMAKMVLG